MPEYAPGTPSWTDLGSPDPDASVGFYGELFGWSATEPGPVEETGGYRMFQQGGGNVAGVMALQSAEQPPAWNTYVSVTDADATAAAVREHGGTVLVEPMDVMDIGRMAFFADPSGAAFGVWQPKTFPGADLVNEPVSLSWNELRTRDTEGAKAFYSAVFGWRPAAWDEDPSGGYTIWNLGDRGIGGMMDMRDELPADVPPHWGVAFAVRDVDAVVARARELGGSVLREPWDLSIGRLAVLADPQGASFVVISSPEA